MILPYILTGLIFTVEFIAGFLYPAYESILLLRENKDFVKSINKRGSYATYNAYIQWLSFWCLSVIIHLVANLFSFIYLVRVLKVVLLVALSHPKILGAHALYSMVFVDPRSKKKLKKIKALVKDKIKGFVMDKLKGHVNDDIIEFSNRYGFIVTFMNKYL